jgi:hypothetical protein
MDAHADNFYCLELHNVITSEWVKSIILKYLRMFRLWLLLKPDGLLKFIPDDVRDTH